MKNSYRQRYITQEKQELYKALMQDKTLQRMIQDCVGTIDEPHLIILLDYVYMLAYQQGRSAGIKLVHDQVCGEKDPDQRQEVQKKCSKSAEKMQKK